MREALWVLASSLSMSPAKKGCVAVVGGGITGACAASELAKHFERVVVFDQGQRGPGGRASHRSVDRESGKVLPDDNVQDHSVKDTYQFDHGCQFFRSDSTEMSTKLLPTWVNNGWVAPWQGRLGCIKLAEEDTTTEFFGVPVRKENVYIALGGMHMLPRKIIESSEAEMHRGTRVARVQRKENRWQLWGTQGQAAYHDTKESIAHGECDALLIEADAVVFTDISSAADSWHRASAGIPNSLRSQIPEKARLPLFSCMVALSDPISEFLPYDGFTVGGTSNLWFASKSQSKPGFPRGGAECWTLVSTPTFAVKEITETTMRDPMTGEFRPQDNSYLNKVPGPALLEAFLHAAGQYFPDGTTLPTAVYLQAQRWGSGLPIPDALVKESAKILGTEYCSELTSSLVFKEKGNSFVKDFVADDNLQIYCAGDFCSSFNPGFEAAALSGHHVAQHISISNPK